MSGALLLTWALAVALTGGEARLLLPAASDPPPGASAEASARAFLAARAGELGMGARDALVRELASTSAPGVVRLRRTIDGLPVLNGSARVLLDARGAVRAARVSGLPARAEGGFAIDEEAAAVAALRGLGPGGRARRVDRAWWALGDRARSVYRVEHVAEGAEWSSLVDAATGEVLFREELQQHVRGRVYAISPVELADGTVCPARGAQLEPCAPTELVDLPNLTSDAALAGAHVTARNCRGGDPLSTPEQPGCDAPPVAAQNGGYDFAPDPAAVTDDFAAVMAYYQLDRHLTWLQGLDPANASVLPPVGAYTNVEHARQPFANAFFSPGLHAVVFGQGATADFAYDASIAFHEASHAAVWAWGGFRTGLDVWGALGEPAALDEGTADALAAAHLGEPHVARYVSAGGSGEGQARDLEEARACQGTGAVVTQLGVDGVVDGLDGEPHDDGQIWSGLFWEVAQGLRGLRACGGTCDGAAALQLAALELAAGQSPSIRSYAEDLEEAARTLVFPARPEVADFVRCVARRRGIDGCDRTFALHRGEAKAQRIAQRFAPFQLVVATTGPAELTFCSAGGIPASVRAREGRPVALAWSDAGDLEVTSDLGPIALTFACNPKTGADVLALPRAGTWYVLVEAPDTVTRGPGIVVATAGEGAITARTAPAAAEPCVLADPPPSPASEVTAAEGRCGASGAEPGPAALAWVAAAALAARRRRPR